MFKRAISVGLMLSMLLGPGGAAPLFAAGAATLDGLDVGPDKVTLHMSEQAKFNTFVTADPPRLVVELLNTEYQTGSKVLEGKGKFLKKVRSGQFEKEPAMISRIVLDLVQLVQYQAAWKGMDLIVSLQDPAGASAPVPAAVPAPQPASSETASPAAVPAAVPSAAAASASGSPVQPAAVQPEAEAAPAVPAAPKAAKKKKVVVPRGFSKELVEMAAARDASAGSRTDAKAQSSSIAEDEEEDSVPHRSGFIRQRRDIMSSLPAESVSLDYENTDIRDVLRLVASKAKINIIFGSDVTGSLTLHLTEVPFNEAFITILQMQGLVADQSGENVLRIMTPATFQKERTTAVNQTRVIPLRYSKAAEIRTAVEAVRQAEGRQGKLNTDDNTNSLIVTDTLDAIASVERLLSKLDVRPQQVMIEAKLVEVKLSKDLNFGIQWDYLNMDNARLGGQQGTNFIGGTAKADTLAKPFDQNDYTVTSGEGATGRGTGVSLPASKIFGAFTFGRVTNNYFLSATLTAAASQGKVKVLSDPKIATINGKQANINITTQIPYVTSNVASTGVTTQQVSYITTGIQLSVTPTINADGRITIDVAPTVSQPSVTAAASITGAPAVDSRTAKTTVIVQDGETVVIGGLITDSVSNTIAKVPLLGDIPILGWLFKKKSVERSRVELLIFVTPHVLPS
ncbi:MAG: type IV pilus secretin PilQ [Elusimicrobiota bacterium]